jgi:hypothetical protein
VFEAVVLKLIASMSPSAVSPAYQFHENLPVSSKVIEVGGTDRQTGKLINFLSVLKVC